MDLNFSSREELKAFLSEEVLTSSEAIQILGISRARLSTMIKDGKIIPFKKMPKDSLFLRCELLDKKKELEHLRRKYRPYEEQ